MDSRFRGKTVGVGGGGREKMGRETPPCTAAVGSCFRRNDEGRGAGMTKMGVGMTRLWGNDEVEGMTEGEGVRGGPPGPARFFVAGPPQNDI